MRSHRMLNESSQDYWKSKELWIGNRHIDGGKKVDTKTLNTPFIYIVYCIYIYTMMVHFDWTIDWFAGNYASGTSTINFISSHIHYLNMIIYGWNLTFMTKQYFYFHGLICRITWKYTHSLHLGWIHGSPQIECKLRGAKKNTQTVFFVHGHILLVLPSFKCERSLIEIYARKTFTNTIKMPFTKFLA